MNAMLLKNLWNLDKNSAPLELCELPNPSIGKGEILIKVSACGVCHTELDEIEGRTPPPRLPIIPGHQVIGKIVENGDPTSSMKIGDRVGVGWIYFSCGKCEFCKKGKENLCSEFRATGRDAHGGYAEYMAIPSTFCFPIPDQISDLEAAPLMCAGAIGYRSLKLTGIENGQTLGLIGFGASAHLILKMVNYSYPDSNIIVFTRNPEEQRFSLCLGAAWAGDIDDKPPYLIHSIIDTTPAWKPIIKAMENLYPGGRLVINSIRKEDTDKDWLMRLEYPTHLWMEKEIKSVANVTSADIKQFLDLAESASIRPEVQIFPLSEANKALLELKNRNIHGAKVLAIS
ncbi:MAG: zinc-dependent alcohol dehydrogenase family protein [Chloroflexota bacterium]